jgi:hypothetical protein
MLPGLRIEFQGAVMAKQRVVSSNYLGVGLAIATGVAANFGSSLEAQAQVNPNIQTQLNIVSPPLQVILAQPENSSQLLKAFKAGTTDVCPPKSTGNLDLNSIILSTTKLPPTVAKKILESVDPKSRESVNPESSESIANYLTANPEKAAALKEKLKKNKQFVQFIPINPTCKYRQPSAVKISFPLNPTYESNILKSGNNGIPGESAGFGGNVLITTGIDSRFQRPWDIVALSGGEASTRYTPNFSPSFDSVTSQAAYQMFLHAYGYDPNANRPVDNLTPETPVKDLPPTGLMTFDTLAFGYQNQTSFKPTFRIENADIFTPQVTLGRQNIGLYEPSGRPCIIGTVDLSPGGSDHRSFCYYANLSLTAGQSFSDVKSLQNFNVAASATLGAKLTSEWSLTLPATATAREFEDVIGGRRDLLLQVGTALNYNPSSSLKLTCPPPPNLACSNGEAVSYSFSLPLTFYKNYSTLATARWSGFIVMPTLTFAFSATGS